MKTKIFITALLMLITYGCTDMCRLTRDDKDWLLEEYKSLNYLENETKTIKVKINTHFDAWYDNENYLTPKGYEWGESTFYIRDSLYWISINSAACDHNGGIYIFKKYHSNYVKAFLFDKDSLTNNTVTILDKEYKNCFVFRDSTYIKNLTFVKNYGIVKIEFRDGYKLELIP